MAVSKSKKKKLQKKAAKAIFGKSLALVMLLVVLFGLICACLYEYCEPFKNFVDELGIFSTKSPGLPPIDPNGDEMAVHFIDVGQGDCTLFQTPKGSVLVDCGETDYGYDIIAYLQAQGVEELEYFIITHPHDDHMGSAAYILENIDVKNFVINGQSRTTAFFTKALDVVEEKGINAIIASPTDSENNLFEIGALQLKIFGPYEDYGDDYNNASLIIHATYGNRSFLLTGDAEKKAEKELLKYHKDDIKCDVFAAGHHGSDTSNTKELLAAAKPEYVAISCGEGYGHPHQEALDNFDEIGAKVYQTNQHGSIVFITDGDTLTKK